MCPMILIIHNNVQKCLYVQTSFKFVWLITCIEEHSQAFLPEVYQGHPSQHWEHPDLDRWLVTRLSAIKFLTLGPPNVCILEKCAEAVTPDRNRSECLCRAGFGRVRIVFPNRKASHNDLQKFLKSKFHKLKAGGGFEVLRAYGGGGG